MSVATRTVCAWRGGEARTAAGSSPCSWCCWASAWWSSTSGGSSRPPRWSGCSSRGGRWRVTSMSDGSSPKRRNSRCGDGPTGSTAGCCPVTAAPSTGPTAPPRCAPWHRMTTRTSDPSRPSPAPTASWPCWCGTSRPAGSRRCSPRCCFSVRPRCYPGCATANSASPRRTPSRCSAGRHWQGVCWGSSTTCCRRHSSWRVSRRRRRSWPPSVNPTTNPARTRRPSSTSPTG